MGIVWGDFTKAVRLVLGLEEELGRVGERERFGQDSGRNSLELGKRDHGSKGTVRGFLSIKVRWGPFAGRGRAGRRF